MESKGRLSGKEFVRGPGGLKRRLSWGSVDLLRQAIQIVSWGQVRLPVAARRPYHLPESFMVRFWERKST
jgi:hypothetical protein